jgi:hypothetical protein
MVVRSKRRMGVAIVKPNKWMGVAGVTGVGLEAEEEEAATAKQAGLAGPQEASGEES